MSAAPMSGRCLCGAIKFSAAATGMAMTACHCGMCRRWAGGALMTVDCAGELMLEGAENLAVYRSSEYGERCFCKTCGTTLFWRMQDGSLTEISAQAFDDPGAFHFAQEIFIDEQPGNYAFAGHRKRLTGAEFFAQFGSTDNG